MKREGNTVVLEVWAPRRTHEKCSMTSSLLQHCTVYRQHLTKRNVRDTQATTPTTPTASPATPLSPIKGITHTDKCIGDNPVLTLATHHEVPYGRDRFQTSNQGISAEKSCQRRQGRQATRWGHDLNKYLERDHDTETTPHERHHWLRGTQHSTNWNPAGTTSHLSHDFPSSHRQVHFFTL